MYTGISVGVPINWDNNPHYFVDYSFTGNKFYVSTYYYNVTLNNSSGTIESFVMNQDDTGSPTNWAGTKSTNTCTAGASACAQAWNSFSGSMGGGSLQSTGAHSDSTYGQNNENCSISEHTNAYLKISCTERDTFDVQRFTHEYIFYPSYFEDAVINDTTLNPTWAKKSVFDDIILDADTEMYSDLMSFSAGSWINIPYGNAIYYYAPDFTGENLFLYHTHVGAASTHCDSSYYFFGIDQYPSPTIYSNESVCSDSEAVNQRVGITKYGPTGYSSSSVSKADWLHDMNDRDGSYAGHYGIRFSRCSNYGSYHIQVHIAPQVDGSAGDNKYSDFFYTDYWDSISAQTLSVCGVQEDNNLNKKTLRKIWASYSTNANEFSGIAVPRNHTYVNGTHFYYAMQEDFASSQNKPFDYLPGFTIYSYAQHAPILQQWYNRTWIDRFVFNLTPSTRVIYPDYVNLSFALPNANCPGGTCQYSTVKTWRIVNDMQEELDFMVRDNGTHGLFFFQGTQLFEDNDTSYFLYAYPNATVDNITEITGDDPPIADTFTFSNFETIINNASVVGTVPASIEVNEYFDVKASYKCSDRKWTLCTPGETITSANCTVKFDSMTYPLYYDGDEDAYINAFKFSEGGSINWNVTCSANQYETRSDSGTIISFFGCGYNQDALTNLQCALDGTKGFFEQSRGGITQLIVAFGVYSFILAIFAFFYGGRFK